MMFSFMEKKSEKYSLFQRTDLLKNTWHE